MFKHIKIWLLQIRISYHMDAMEEAARLKRDNSLLHEVHRLKRNNLTARLQRTWYE